MSEKVDTDPVLLDDSTYSSAYCPNPNMPLWSSHPRIYLEFAANGEARCPYCGTVYRLKPGAMPKH